MDAAQTVLCTRSPQVFVSARIELPDRNIVRDMFSVLGLFSGLLRDEGERIRTCAQTNETEARIETQNFALSLWRKDNQLSMRIRPRGSETTAEQAEVCLVKMLRAAFTVLKPVSIRWLNKDMPIDPHTFLDVVGRVVPGKPPKVLQAKRTHKPKAVLHKRAPQIAAPERIRSMGEEDLRDAYTNWTGPDYSASARNRFEPESAVRRLMSWSLTGVTTALYLPAGVAMIILNLFKGENLRLNAHAMSLTAVAVILHNSGVVSEAMRVWGPEIAPVVTQAFEALKSFIV